MIKKNYYGIKIYFLMFLAVNALSLQKLLTHKNKKKNNKGILFKFSLLISRFYKWCLDQVLKDSKKIC